MVVKRPALRWHGGKWILADWIIPFFPPHCIYVEPFGGAASILLKKSRVQLEIYNDLDEDVVNLFRVLRDPVAAGELERRLRLTPFARGEFETARLKTPPLDTIERARRLVARSFMGFGSDSHNVARTTGFRSNPSLAFRTSPALDWSRLPDNLPAITRRLAGIVIERGPAIKIMRFFDGPMTLHYVDPPYVMSARSKNPGRYAHEMDDDDHRALADCLRSLTGFVVLSGYSCPLYDELYAGWARHDRAVRTNRGYGRVESLWLNTAAAEAHGAGRLL